MFVVLDQAAAESLAKQLRYNADGLIPAIAQDYQKKSVLMMAWMNLDAVIKTLTSGDVWYWSRSRGELWRKGATSGHTQRLQQMVIDCDQDSILLSIEQTGPACHTNRPSCFFYTPTADGQLLIREDMPPSFAPV